MTDLTIYMERGAGFTFEGEEIAERTKQSERLNDSFKKAKAELKRRGHKGTVEVIERSTLDWDKPQVYKCGRI